MWGHPAGTVKVTQLFFKLIVYRLRLTALSRLVINPGKHIVGQSIEWRGACFVYRVKLFKSTNQPIAFDNCLGIKTISYK